MHTDQDTSRTGKRDDFAAPCANDAELAKLRGELREFLAADRAEFGWRPKVDAWLSSWDEAFSARLARPGSSA